MVNVQIIDLFFQFVNLAIVVGIVYFVYCRFLRKILIESVQQANLRVPTLEQEIVSLEESATQVDETLREQKAEVAILADKVQHWHNTVQQELQAKQQTCAELQAKGQLRLERQEQLTQKNKVIRKTVTVVMERAEQQLCQDDQLHDQMLSVMRTLWAAQRRKG